MSTCKFILHINECGILYINILCLISAITFLPSMLKAANISLKRKYLPINIEDEYFSSDSQCFAQYYASGKRKNKKKYQKRKTTRKGGRTDEETPPFPLSNSLFSLRGLSGRGCFLFQSILNFHIPIFSLPLAQSRGVNHRYGTRPSSPHHSAGLPTPLGAPLSPPTWVMSPCQHPPEDQDTTPLPLGGMGDPVQCLQDE